MKVKKRLLQQPDLRCQLLNYMDKLMQQQDMAVKIEGGVL